MGCGEGAPGLVGECHKQQERPYHTPYALLDTEPPFQTLFASLRVMGHPLQGQREFSNVRETAVWGWTRLGLQLPSGPTLG